MESQEKVFPGLTVDPNRLATALFFSERAIFRHPQSDGMAHGMGARIRHFSY
jgi:hypothetical protein